MHPPHSNPWRRLHTVGKKLSAPPPPPFSLTHAMAIIFDLVNIPIVPFYVSTVHGKEKRRWFRHVVVRNLSLLVNKGASSTNSVRCYLVRNNVSFEN